MCVSTHLNPPSYPQDISIARIVVPCITASLKKSRLDPVMNFIRHVKKQLRAKKVGVNPRTADVSARHLLRATCS